MDISMKVFLFKWKIKQIDWKRILCSPWLGQTMQFTWWQPPRPKAHGRGWGGWVAPQAWPCKSKPAEGGLVSARVNQVCRNHWSGAGRTKPTKRRAEKEGTATSLDWQKTSESGNPWALCHPASGHSSGNLTSPVSKYILHSELGLWNSS